MNKIPSGRRSFFLISLALLFLFCLLLIPSGLSPSQLVLENIARSLDAGLNWGRQCLAGSIRYPLLPVLWQWLCLHGGPVRPILAALPAFGCLHFLCRWHFDHRSAGEFSLPDLLNPGLACLFFIYASFLKLRLGPEAFLLTGTLFYLLRYFEKENNLGNLVMAAFCLGLLTLCGFLAILYAGILMLEINAGTAFLKNARQGVRLNFSLPFCYGLLLLLLLNWLIMEDGLFYFHQIFLWTSSCTWTTCSQSGNAVQALLLLNLPGMIFPVMLLLAKNRNCRRCGRLLLIATALVLLREMLRTVLGFQTDQMQMSCLMLEFWAAMMLFLPTEPHEPLSLRRHAWVVLLLLLIAGSHCRLHDNAAFETISETQEQNFRISRTELEKYIDHYWQDSRIIVLGDRLPAQFGDYSEKRYVSRLDYQKWEILKQAEDEQLHLLLPPPEAGCHPGGKDSPLADIYKNGAPWLLLEKLFPGGWQLLRVVPPPKGESRLDQFL